MFCNGKWYYFTYILTIIILERYRGNNLVNVITEKAVFRVNMEIEHLSAWQKHACVFKLLSPFFQKEINFCSSDEVIRSHCTEVFSTPRKSNRRQRESKDKVLLNTPQFFLSLESKSSIISIIFDTSSKYIGCTVFLFMVFISEASHTRKSYTN